MAYVVEALGKLHEGQVAAATRAQGMAAEVARKLAELRDDAPALPEQVLAPIQRAIAPFARVVGTPVELASLVRKNARDWVELQIEFQTALVGALGGDSSSRVATIHAM